MAANANKKCVMCEKMRLVCKPAHELDCRGRTCTSSESKAVQTLDASLSFSPLSSVKPRPSPDFLRAGPASNQPCIFAFVCRCLSMVSLAFLCGRLRMSAPLRAASPP